MDDASDPQLALMFSLFEGLRLKAPGSRASTLRALSALPGPPPARLVDFGCGGGAASLVLAQATQGVVTAVDIHQPFLDELNAEAARQGLSERIQTVQGDMGDPPFPDQSFDLAWSEGAIYNVGLRNGLQLWRRLLRPGGCVAVSEVSWLSDAPPAKAVEFWTQEYPAMTSIENNLAEVRAAGFETIGHFALPPEDWEGYYGPLQAKLAAFRQEHAENAAAQSLADEIQREIDVFREFGQFYGYVFYLGRLA